MNKTYEIFIKCSLRELEEFIERIEAHPQFIRWPEDPIIQLARFLGCMSNPNQKHKISNWVCYEGMGYINELGNGFSSSCRRYKLTNYSFMDVGTCVDRFITSIIDRNK
jgi:hypothetical protein